MKRYIIIGLCAFLLISLVGAIDIYWTQEQLDAFDVENATYADFNCQLQGDEPYIYRDGPYLHTDYTCRAIEKIDHPTHPYHIYDGEYRTINTVAWAKWCLNKYPADFCVDWYWWDAKQQAKDVMDATKDQIRGWQTDDFTIGGWNGTIFE